MLSITEMSALLDKFGTPSNGRALVDRARRGKPVREVKSNGGNVITLFVSRKMRRQIATESRTIEFPAAVQYEHDDAVLEFYPQPFQLDVVQELPGQRKQRFQHTPDFIVIRKDGLFVDEWKPEARLDRTAKKSPERFVKLFDGWHCPPLEEQLAACGMTYRLRTEANLDRTYVENMNFLADYLGTDPGSLSDRALAAIRETLSQHSIMHLSDLIAAGVRRTHE